MSHFQFSNISTGVYRFPKQRLAEIAVATVQTYLQQTELEVTFVCFEASNWNIYRELLGEK